MNDNQIIAVFCYKRTEKLKESIGALLTNPEAADSEIIFFCDGYKGEADKDGVLSTRAFIDGLTGFKKIYKMYRPENFGIHKNFSNGLTYLSANHDSFIVVEDDVVVSDNFLRFMNDGLAFYKDQKSIFAITGFCFPLKNIERYEYDSAIHWRMCVYGWASWSDRVRNVKFSNEDLSHIVKNSPGFKARLNKEGHDLYRLVQKQFKGNISTWDVQVQVYVSENGKKVVYPVKSKTSNIGFDDQSSHTSGVNFLETTMDTSHKRAFIFCNEDILNETIIDQLRGPYKLPELIRRKLINESVKLGTKLKLFK
jgi:Glycosyl transferase family 2